MVLRYVNDIITNLNHWAAGWTDWNLALDMNGGPNWANNFVDAPIIVNAAADEFYKQPMYYGLAHFSKFLPEGSQRVGLAVTGYDAERVAAVALERPDGALVVVATNQHADTSLTVRIVVEERRTRVITLQPQSVHSFIWQEEEQL